MYIEATTFKWLRKKINILYKFQVDWHYQLYRVSWHALTARVTCWKIIYI